jgi:hypothetical protein
MWSTSGVPLNAASNAMSPLTLTGFRLEVREHGLEAEGLSSSTVELERISISFLSCVYKIYIYTQVYKPSVAEVV